jgi:hypothetical protein
VPGMASQQKRSTRSREADRGRHRETQTERRRPARNGRTIGRAIRTATRALAGHRREFPGKSGDRVSLTLLCGTHPADAKIWRTHGQRLAVRNPIPFCVVFTIAGK